MPDMAQALRTPLCRALGIEYPIFSAGMGTGAGPDLAAAVSNAGGFGVIGASAFLPDAIPGLVRQVRDRTTRPFGVNIIIDIDEPDFTDDDRAILGQQVSAAISAKVAAVVLFWGDPSPYIEEAHSGGVRVIIQVGSLDEAKAAAAAGVDAVIAQGVEAGGHVRGSTSIWTLLPAVVEAIKPVPVLASGGIGDGAGVARALRLGRRASRSGRASSPAMRPRSTPPTSNASSRALRRTQSSASCTTHGGQERRTGRSATRPSKNGMQRDGRRQENGPARGLPSGSDAARRVSGRSGRGTQSEPFPRTSRAT